MTINLNLLNILLQNCMFAAIYANYPTNKYAIYAYTDGPVTGSGPSVVTSLLPPLCSHSQLVVAS